MQYLRAIRGELQLCKGGSCARLGALYTALMRISRLFALVVALAAGLLVGGYAYASQFFTKKIALNQTQGDTCIDTERSSSERKENPNRMLFISCGGFL